MRLFKSITNPEIVALLSSGAIGVVPTDTLYGLVVGTAFPGSIERMYEVRQRPAEKGCITLLADKNQADDIVNWTHADRQLAQRYWPGPVSIILPVNDAVPEYLHPVNGTLAFRVPGSEVLRDLLQYTGPLLAPSANLAGAKPAATIAEAQAYFGDAIDFYIDAGDLSGNRPSTLIRNLDGEIDVLRGSLPDNS